MGAGARLAEERDRWAEHWRVADLEQELEHLLDSLGPDEELRAAVPGSRTSTDGARPVVIGVTDRRILLIGRQSVPRSDGGDTTTAPVVDDVTAQVVPAAPRAAIDVDGGTVDLDLDAEALERLWDQVARLDDD